MDIFFVGGDARVKHAARYLRESGINAVFGEDGYGCGAAVLPYPCFENGKIKGTEIPFDEFSEKFGRKKLILGGGLPEGKDRLDYAKDEKFLRENAFITAEGAVYTAMGLSEKILNGSKILVAGYGRIGFYLCGLLLSLGCEVTALARREESRLAAKKNGVNALDYHDAEGVLRSADVIFNTVPAIIFGEKEIALTKAEAIFIELASKPYGVDLSAAERLGRKVTVASGLPAKYAPDSAGRALAKAIINALERRKGLAD